MTSTLSRTPKLNLTKSEERPGTAKGINFLLPVPPSANNLFFNLPKGGRAETQRYRAWQVEAGWRMKEQTIERLEPGPVEMTVSVPFNARRDLSNHLKAIEDFVVKQGILVDDRAKYVHSIVLRWHHLENCSECAVIIRRVNDCFEKKEANGGEK